MHASHLVNISLLPKIGRENQRKELNHKKKIKQNYTYIFCVINICLIENTLRKRFG